MKLYKTSISKSLLMAAFTAFVSIALNVSEAKSSGQHYPVVIDSLQDTQWTQTKQASSGETTLELSVESTHLSNVKRSIYVHAHPEQLKSSSFVMIDHGELYIDNLVNKKEHLFAGVTVSYTFEIENISQYSGVKIKTFGMQTDGNLLLTIKSGGQYIPSNLHSFNGCNNRSFKDTCDMDISFKEFKGIRKNLSFLSVTILDVAQWSGDMSIEFIPKKK